MFSLSDEELDRVMAAASMLPPSRRDVFVRSVAGRVAHLPNFGLAEIECAIQFVLNQYGVIGGRTFNGTPDKAARARQKAEGVFR